jgi:hypothetical protein
VTRGVMTHRQLAAVHAALEEMLAAQGARVDLILCCGNDCKCTRRKPSAGMLTEALARFGAAAAETPFVGDQLDDLKAAFHARCRRVLVRTGLGRKIAGGRPSAIRLAGLRARRSRRGRRRPVGRQALALASVAEHDGATIRLHGHNVRSQPGLPVDPFSALPVLAA